MSESRETGRLITSLIYFDGKHDKHIYQIVNRYARKYNREQPYAGAGIVESPVFIDSNASKLIQLADVLTYSTNHVHRTLNPIESSVRIDVKTATDILEEVEYPLKYETPAFAGVSEPTMERPTPSPKRFGRTFIVYHLFGRKSIQWQNGKTQNRGIFPFLGEYKIA